MNTTPSNADFKVFLDLEQTVLTNWAEGELVNTTKVREFLALNKVKSWDVFSFAVWNNEDRREFWGRHASFLERSLDCFCKTCPTVEEFMSADTLVTGVHFDSLTDFISIRGKVGAFTSWCRLNFPKKNCLLVDDVVTNLDLVNHDDQNILRFINVSQL